MADLARVRSELASLGTQFAFVHPSDQASNMAAMLSRFQLPDVPHIADPEARLYRAFELRRMKLRDLFSPAMWKRGREAIRHGVGMKEGDALRLGGLFLLAGDRVLAEYRHRLPSDRPDYVAFTREGLQKV